ncbi:MAG TPA: YidC/Oxa1 family membrane protein insertase [bacterium]|nr:YidC/Oxa1 family membrane protein insertase [bacterium]HPT29472.1 YidC/Oxa1 family membrane protein insertase [bacterium]
MGHIFQVVFYQPILNLLVFLYNTISFHDLGIAIILLTIIIKGLLWPLSQKSIKAQKALQDLQPKINDLKAKYKGDKQQMSLAMMALYKEHKINPMSSCFPVLLQLPFLWAVFQVFRDGLHSKLDLVYPFITRPESINMMAFGFLDLSKVNIYLAILAGLAQFWQTKMMLSRRPTVKTAGSKDEDMAAIMNKQMVYMMPILTIFIGISLPGGLTFYWLIVTILTGVQQVIVFKKHKKANDKLTAEKVIDAEIVK